MISKKGEIRYKSTKLTNLTSDMLNTLQDNANMSQ